MAYHFTAGRFQAFDNSGNPLNGGKVYTYSAGTTTPKATYTTQTAGTSNANPVVLDSAGRAAIWLGSGAYRIVVKSADEGTTFTDDDNISATTYADDLANSTSATKGAALVGFDPELAYAAPSLGWMLQQSEWSVLWFEDVRTAVAAGTDCTAAVQAVYDLMLTAGRRSLFFPAHTNGYVFSGGTASADGYKNGLLCRFTQVNFDVSSTVVIRGEGGTVWKCNSNSMILLRIARNNVTVRDITLDANGKTSVYLCGIVPEDMTQTTTLVSQSMVNFHDVNMEGGASVDGIVIMPGPTVGGSDSGCFYHNFFGGVSNFVGGGRHVWLKKNVDWATNPNRPTRTNFYGLRLIRGNTGYHFDVGSEVYIQGNEELIASGTTPNATPVARYISNDCTNIWFGPGYPEACSASLVIGAANIVYSMLWFPASGSDSNFNSYVSSWGDYGNQSRDFTPVVASSAGGTQGAGTVVGKATKHGRTVTVTIQISVAKGTLGAAGTISVSGLPFVAATAWSNQNLEVTSWSGITLGTNYVKLNALISGAGVAIQKQHGQGAGVTGLLVSDCSDPIVFTIQGSYEA